jgi:hypothetical protein
VLSPSNPQRQSGTEGSIYTGLPGVAVVPSGLLTSYRLDAIRAHERLAGKSLPAEHSLGSPTRYARVRGTEVQQQVRFAILVDILNVPLAVCVVSPSAGRRKPR